MTATINSELVNMNSLSVVLLGQSEGRRKTLAAALAGTPARVVREAQLAGPDTLPSLLQGDIDVLIVDLHEDSERGLRLVEAACGPGVSTVVMVYARLTDSELLVRSMRAGAREYLSDPLSPTAVTEALVRASARRAEVKRQKRTGGECLVFAGAKGGSGVTTVAANFAVALAKESGQRVILLDLNLRLGDAALDLGLASEFSTLDALENEDRMDSELVAKLLKRHNSGLQVLAAPTEYNTYRPTWPGVMRLVNILRNDSAWVVVDAGTHFDGYGPGLFDTAQKVFLVTQVSVAELRNSNRFISAHFRGEAVRKLEVVLNRYSPRAGEIDERSIAKALTVRPVWKIPSDYQAVHQAQNSGTALVLRDGPISRVLHYMARITCGKGPENTKKRRFSLFG